MCLAFGVLLLLINPCLRGWQSFSPLQWINVQVSHLTGYSDVCAASLKPKVHLLVEVVYLLVDRPRISHSAAAIVTTVAFGRAQASHAEEPVSEGIIARAETWATNQVPMGDPRWTFGSNAIGLGIRYLSS